MRIKDNSSVDFASASDSTFDDLSAIANITLSEGQKRNPNLLVFPHCMGEFGDGIGEECVCTMEGVRDSFRLITGNIMGFIGLGNTELTICSRFSGEDKNDFFLHYMLQKVFCPNLFEWKHSYTNENVFDFLIYLFPHYLNKALAQGLYKEYRRYEYNDSKIKGCVDVNRHIRHNVPFAGRIAYNTREHSYDNRITQLIRHTIEYIFATPYGNSVLSNAETQQSVRIIKDCTQTYSRNNLRRVISENIKAVHHPYLTSYTILQKLCLQILRHDGLKYDEGTSKVYGILFDGAWLWEEYLNTILSRYGFIHPENKKGTNPIHLFEDNSGLRYPDFYKKNDIVLDAKYKRIASYDRVSQMDRNDIHQIIAYMQCLKASRGGFIAPVYNKQTQTPCSTLKGTTSTISILGLEISKAKTYSEFCSDMHKFEEELSQSLMFK